MTPNGFVQIALFCAVVVLLVRPFGYYMTRVFSGGRKKIVPASAGTFPTDGGLFVGLLIGVILIMGGLIYFPALALGPIEEHLAMRAGSLF